MKQTMNTIVTLVVFLGIGSIQVFAAPFAKVNSGDALLISSAN